MCLLGYCTCSYRMSHNSQKKYLPSHNPSTTLLATPMIDRPRINDRWHNWAELQLSRQRCCKFDANQHRIWCQPTTVWINTEIVWLIIFCSSTLDNVSKYINCIRYIVRRYHRQLIQWSYRLYTIFIGIILSSLLIIIMGNNVSSDTKGRNKLSTLQRQLTAHLSSVRQLWTKCKSCALGLAQERRRWRCVEICEESFSGAARKSSTRPTINASHSSPAAAYQSQQDEGSLD